ncbi:MAG: cytochrome O ubiquinol oxidase [Acidiferrobacter sp.]
MTHTTDNAWEHPEVQLAGGGYIVAFVVGLALMGLSLWMVRGHVFAPTGLAVAISALAAVAAFVQCVLLLHMTVSRTQVWHTVALVLFIPLFVITIGLTSWMFHGLYRRTMMMPSAHLSAPATPTQPRGA